VGVGAERRSAPTARPRVISGSLGAIVRGYKSAVTYAINGAQNTRGAVVWQRNYHEHIIRNETEFKNIWNYIDTNPARWEDDQLHPSAPPNQFNQDRA
jgi:putative transposase